MTRPRIAISQRVVLPESHKERRDALDQRWGELLWELGFIAIPVPNLTPDPAVFLDSLGVNAVLLSGGNDMSVVPDATDPAPERDKTEMALISLCEKRRLPLLGVCRGMQVLAHYYDLPLERLSGHVGKAHQVETVPSRYSEGKAVFEVNSFHHFGLRTVGAPLKAVAKSDDGYVEALEHEFLPFAGIMWHPERRTPDPWTRRLIGSLFGGQP